MTGARSSVPAELGLLLALSKVANLPAGFATRANFRSQGVERRIWLIATAPFARFRRRVRLLCVACRLLG